MQTVKPGKSKIGFMIAAACILLGALLLVVVYSLSLANNGGNTSNVNTLPTHVVSTATTAATTPTATPSPTATAMPGAQYITSAQTVASFDDGTNTPGAAQSSFKAGDTIYVSFALSPPSSGGAVCTYWFSGTNTTPAVQYGFAVGTTKHTTYATAQLGIAGDASVELDWASDKNCTDRQEAQVVKFTVTSS
jgi:hypothetical protein